NKTCQDKLPGKQGHVIYADNPLNSQELLTYSIFNKFEARSSKSETNTNDQNSKFQTWWSAIDIA
ncbi:MAG: hypothetical protein ACNYWU_08110, partial [Desulfobacterales bacterium]